MTEQELKQNMKNLVKDWWGNLTDDQKTAVKLLKFSPSIIGSMFFFDGDTTNKIIADDYNKLRRVIADYGIDREDFSCGISWDVYHKNMQECRRIEKGIAGDYLIKKLPDNLKEQVVDNLRRQDAVWNHYRLEIIKSLKEARKTMFWDAITELRKNVEG